MYTYPFLLIKNRLQARIAELKEVDWFLNQYLKDSKGHVVYTVPATYIEFLPLATQQLGGGLQTASVQFKVHTVTTNMHDNHKRIQKQLVTDHAKIVDATYQALSGLKGLLSDIRELAALAGTKDDGRVMNTVNRTTITPPHELRSLMVTVQDFTCRIYDHSANKTLTKIVADLEIQ